MRIRVLTSVAAALLAAPAVSAVAGTGPSNWCGDGLGQEVTILSTPVTVAVEANVDPVAPHQLVVICYSTTPAGTPGGLTGGAVVIDVQTDTSTASPSANVTLLCFTDPGAGVGPGCNLPSSAAIAPDDLSVSAPPTGICLVNLSGSCAAYAPGLRVATGDDPQSTAALTVLGVPVPVDLPPQCIAVLADC